ncbi:hypothetical protein BDK51DRAFT_49803, partial [Blyttiomyces helicus]
RLIAIIGDDGADASTEAHNLDFIDEFGEDADPDDWAALRIENESINSDLTEDQKEAIKDDLMIQERIEAVGSIDKSKSAGAARDTSASSFEDANVIFANHALASTDLAADELEVGGAPSAAEPPCASPPDRSRTSRFFRPVLNLDRASEKQTSPGAAADSAAKIVRSCNDGLASGSGSSSHCPAKVGGFIEPKSAGDTFANFADATPNFANVAALASGNSAADVLDVDGSPPAVEPSCIPPPDRGTTNTFFRRVFHLDRQRKQQPKSGVPAADSAITIVLSHADAIPVSSASSSLQSVNVSSAAIVSSSASLVGVHRFDPPPPQPPDAAAAPHRTLGTSFRILFHVAPRRRRPVTEAPRTSLPPVPHPPGRVMGRLRSQDSSPTLPSDSPPPRHCAFEDVDIDANTRAARVVGRAEKIRIAFKNAWRFGTGRVVVAHAERTAAQTAVAAAI